jgi:hypothetical protein
MHPIIVYLRSRHSPHLEIIRPHINIRNPLAEITHNPLIKVFWLGVCNAGLERGVNQCLDAFHLVVFRERGDVVLEGERHPAALVAHVRYALVVVPVVCCWEGLVDAVVEVFVVREDDVAADVEELQISFFTCSP